jgi:hypothetical protein
MPETRTARIAHERSHTETFCNYRDWRAFLTAIPVPAACASVATALKAGHDWLTGRGWMAESGSETCTRLLGDSGLVAGKTLGV